MIFMLHLHGESYREYDRFASIIRERDLAPIKRKRFKDLVSPIIRDKSGTGLRSDLVVDGRYQRGWKDLALNAGVGLGWLCYPSNAFKCLVPCEAPKAF